MSSGSYLQVYVQCPFYKTDDGAKRIMCEGLAGEKSSIVLVYPTKDDMLTQMKMCCSSYKRCGVYRIVMEGYREE